MYSESKSNTLKNTEYDAKINVERRTPLKELLNCEKSNNLKKRVKRHKKRQEVLNADKGKHVYVTFANVIFFKLNKIK